MNAFREKRARAYEKQDGGVCRKQRVPNDPYPSRFDSINTSVDDYDESDTYSDSNWAEDEEDLRFSSYEENDEVDTKEEEEEEEEEKQVVGGSKSNATIRTEPQNESEKPIFNVETRNDSSVETRENVDNCKVAEQGTAVQQSIRLLTVNENGTVISQQMNELPLHHTGAIIINQRISIPSSNWEHPATPKNGSPTPSNIARHLSRQQDGENKLSSKRPSNKQNVLDSFPIVRLRESKPIPFTKKLLQFLALNHFKLRILNMFIEGFLPFSMIELQGMTDILNVCNTAGLPIISSRKELVDLLSSYEKELNEQLKHAMRHSDHLNILIDTWTSANQKNYLAVMVSFCPNLNQNSRLKREDITNDGKSNTRILDFIDLSCKQHTSETLKSTLLSCLSEYSISHKIGSITLGNGLNNIPMFDSIEEMFDSGFELDGVRKLFRVTCMDSVLKSVFLDLLKAFENDHKSLLTRIDKLAFYTESNVYIRNKMRSYTPCTIPKNNTTRFLSRYRQLEVFLRLSKASKEFFFDNRFKPEFQKISDECSVFCYQKEEVEYILFFVRIARIFQEFTVLLQDDTTNSLCNGIEYYMNIRQYYKSCEELERGSEDISHLANVGLKKIHLPSNDIKEQVLSAVMDSYPKFENYMKLAFKEPGYWVAHILQPHRKTDLLNRSFDQSFKEEVIDSATTYVANYCNRYAEKFNIPVRSRPLNNNRVKKSKVLRNLSAYLDRNIVEFHYTPMDEWRIYLEEPLERDVDFLSYWLENQSKFPSLFSLALTFYHTKLSIADVERSFSISKRVLDNRFSLGSSNLKSTMILRNRLKCFNFSTKMPVVEHIATDSCSDDEEDIEYSDVSQQSTNEPPWAIDIYSSDSSDSN